MEMNELIKKNQLIHELYYKSEKIMCMSSCENGKKQILEKETLVLGEQLQTCYVI